MQAALPGYSRIVVLDERGSDLSTLKLAQRLEDWMREGGDTAFIIGSADGIDEELKQRASETLRLSSLTLPHAMARLILCETVVSRCQRRQEPSLSPGRLMPTNLNNPRIHLASRSPRRRELLAQIGIPFDTIVFRNPPRADRELDETPLADETPIDYVNRVARAKAGHGWRIVGWRKLLPQPVLAADTTLEFEGEIIGKPVDAADAHNILRRLSGHTHRVLSAVAIAL